MLSSGSSASASVLAFAVAVDLAFGELPASVHPVVWMGNTVRVIERALPTRGVVRQLAAGTALALVVPAGFAAAAATLIGVLERWPAAAWLAEALLLTAMFAGRALGEAARTVQRALEASDLGGARYALRSLCSRDASRLGTPELVAASVESVAENASDSWVAPLFYYVLFGLPGAVAYRTVNTLDAMVGYHGRYEYLGKASARLDDVLNWIPARLTALLLLASGALAEAARGGPWRETTRRGIRIWRRDARKTESPNAGHPMAAMAGLLGVPLEKAGHYVLGGPEHAERGTPGAEQGEPSSAASTRLTPRTIERAWVIVQLAGGVAVGLAVSALVALGHSG